MHRSMKRLLFGRKKSKSVPRPATTANGSVNGQQRSSCFEDVAASSAESRPAGAGAARGSAYDEWCAASTSCQSDDRRIVDSALDKHMMQTITDVKYVKHRPKFIVFGDVNFQRECLDAHNALRNKYGCTSLIWSQELAELAHTWAEKLGEKGRILYPELQGISRQLGIMQILHISDPNFNTSAGIGENIRLHTTTSQMHLPSGVEVVDVWSREADSYNFETPRWQYNCQHFTQMVWRESEQFGVARCWNPAKCIVVIVAFYRPGGNSNAPGEFSTNVPSKSASMLHFDGAGDNRPASAPLNEITTVSSGTSPFRRNMLLSRMKRSITLGSETTAGGL